MYCITYVKLYSASRATPNAGAPSASDPKKTFRGRFEVSNLNQEFNKNKELPTLDTLGWLDTRASETTGAIDFKNIVWANQNIGGAKGGKK